MSEYRPLPPAYPPIPAPTSSMATVSLISGILGWVLLPIIGPIVAVITGHMAKREIRDSGGQIGGDGLATAGLVLGYVQIGLAVVGVCLGACFFALMAASATGSSY